MASIKAFAIPELLEAVLLELQPRDILIYQRVSRVWHDTIMDTPSVQRKVWYELSQNSQSVSPPVLNPMLQHLLGTEFIMSIARATPCPRPRIWCTGDHNYEYCVNIVDKGLSLQHRMRFRQKKGSWTSMLISQPPIAIHYIASPYPAEKALEEHLSTTEAKTFGEFMEKHMIWAEHNTGVD